MKQYKQLLVKILEEGHLVPDRTGTGTTELFGEQIKFDLADGFPLVTGKETPFKLPMEELRWMLSGSTNVNDLDLSIWAEWADEEGDLGRIYGFQWRQLAVDQIEQLVSGLKRDPHSRRHIVDSWNVEQLSEMALAPCHSLLQCNIANGKINLHMYQRSADMFLGVPTNIAFYALLLELLAFELELTAGVLTISYGSVHIYNDHMEQVQEYLTRGRHELPILKVVSSDVVSATFDVELIGYECGDKIPAPVSV